MKKEYSLALGERTAEDIKLALGSAWPLEQELPPRSAAATSSPACPRPSPSPPARSATPSRSPPTAIVDAVKATLDKTPPELAADIMEQGIMITGGGALLTGLDLRLEHETGMPIHIANNPLAVRGDRSGQALEEFDALQPRAVLRGQER